MLVSELAELRGSDGKPLVLPKGSWVVDAIYLNKVPGTTRWYTPFAAGDAAGRVRVPSHMVLAADIAMTPAVAPVPPKKKNKRWTAGDAKRAAVELGAVVLPDEVHDAVMDELDQRDL